MIKSKNNIVFVVLLSLLLPSYTLAEGNHKKKAVALAIVSGFFKVFTAIAVGATIGTLKVSNNKVWAVVPGVFGLAFFASAMATHVAAHNQLDKAEEERIKKESSANDASVQNIEK